MEFHVLQPGVAIASIPVVISAGLSGITGIVPMVTDQGNQIQKRSNHPGHFRQECAGQPWEGRAQDMLWLNYPKEYGGL